MIYWFCLVLILAALLVERFWLQHRRAKVPLRVHIHGTRGKSGLTRSLADLLRAQGLRVLAKTTGDRPEYILPNGSIEPIHRIGPARIREHVDLLHKAASLKAEVVLAEGMALQPETVYLSEIILQSTHAIIVNTRPDHAETMGCGCEGVAKTLRLMIPDAGKLFIAEEPGAEVLKKHADQKSIPCDVVKAPALKQSEVLARVVAEAIFRERKSRRNHNHMVCHSVAQVQTINVPGLPVDILDFLSANDVVSSQLLLKECGLRQDYLTVALLATRADRPLRTREFMNWIPEESLFDAVAVMGSHAGYALLRGLMGHERQRLLRVKPWLPPERLLDVMRKIALMRGKRGLTVVALGNFHGYGEKWRAMARQKASFFDGANRGA